MQLHRQPLFRFLFALIALIAVLHIVAFKLHFYWQFWWFDMLMHFLGGLWVGLSALWFIFFSGYVGPFRARLFNTFAVSLFSIVVVGSVWEFFELWIGFPTEENYTIDTTIDLIMDIVGAFTGYVYVVFKYIKTSTMI